MFLKKKWMKHVKNEAAFEDQDLFYVFEDKEIENRLEELYVYRKQQVSNQVRLSLDIVTPTKAELRPSRKSESIYTIFDDEDGHDSDELLIDYRHSSMDISAERYVKY